MFFSGLINVILMCLLILWMFVFGGLNLIICGQILVMKWLFDVLFVVDSLVVMLYLVWMVEDRVLDRLFCLVRKGLLFSVQLSVQLRLCVFRMLCMCVLRLFGVLVVEKWKLKLIVMWFGMIFVVFVLLWMFDICYVVGGKQVLLLFYLVVVSLVSVGVVRWIGFLVRCGQVMWFCMLFIESLFDSELCCLFFIMLLSVDMEVGLLIMQQLRCLLCVCSRLYILMVLLCVGFFLLLVIKKLIELVWFGCLVMNFFDVIMKLVMDVFMLVVLWVQSLLL